MFEVTCDECGKTATVPFEPKEGKAVYCSACFSKRVSTRRERSKLSFSFDSKNAWARRDSSFKGKKEQEPSSIFNKY
jgi:CxxC-x17-CxxC domain-containing protein